MRIGLTGRPQILVGSLAIGILAVGTGCGTSSTGGSTSSSADLSVTVDTSPVNLDPMSGSQFQVTVLRGNVSEGLTQFVGSSTKVEPALATSWKQLKSDEWEFKLRSGVKFQDGEPFNAAAVKFSIARMQDPKKAWTFAGDFVNIGAVKIAGGGAVDIATKGPDPLLPEQMAVLPVVPPKMAEEGKLAQRPTGTGPYKFVSTSPTTFVLARNPNYWGPRPKFAKVTINYQQEASSRIAAVKTGTADIGAAIPYDLTPTVSDVISGPVLETMLIDLNGKAGATSDPRVREGMAEAVNTDAIRKNVLSSKFTSPANCQYSPPQTSGYDPSLRSPQYNLANAKALIKAAGAVGKTVVLTAPANRYAQGSQVMQAVAADIDKTGLKVDLKILDEQSWLKTVTGSKGQFVDGVFFGASSDYGDALAPLRTYVDEASPLERFPHSQAPKVQSLLDKAASAPTPQKRQSLMDQLDTAVCKANPAIFLYNYDNVWAVRNGVSFTPRLDSGFNFDSVTVK